jgi:hypothetical protein
MEFESLHNFAKGRVIERTDALNRIEKGLKDLRNSVILISGELNPGTYNKSAVGEALRRRQGVNDRSVTLCWGPSTYLLKKSNGEGINTLYESIESCLDLAGLTILYSNYRQDCHMWVLGDEVIYQKPHRVGAGAVEKVTLWNDVACGVAEFVQQDLDQQLKAGDIVRLNNTLDNLRCSFRFLNVDQDEVGCVKKYVDPAQPEEAVDYFVSLVKSLSQVAEVRFIREESHIEIISFITDEGPKGEVIERITDYEIWTMDRYVDLDFDFHCFKVSSDRLKEFDGQEGTVRFRRRG